jgi:hypothetical protein
MRRAHVATVRNAAGLILLAVSALAACGDDAGSPRADQVRTAASNAGLASDVQDFLALLSVSGEGTYQITYPNERSNGTLVVTQQPPNRRVDIISGTDVLESRLVRGDRKYDCTADDKGVLTCDTAGTATPAGAFDPDALNATVDKIVAAASSYDLTIKRRTLVRVEATCLITTRRADAPDDPTAADLGEVCLSAEGGVLRVISGATSLEATGYTTHIPKGIFDLPAKR